MDELGEILRQAREKKRLTIEKVYEDTRINPLYLQAFEEGNYAALPSSAHARGFLRNYVRYLGLDPAPLLERFNQSQAYQRQIQAQNQEGRHRADDETSAPIVLTHSIEDQPFFDPVNVEVDLGSRRDPESAVRLVIIAALILAVALVGNRFLPLILNNSDGSEAVTEGITNAVQDLVNRGSAQEGNEGEAESTAEATPDATSDAILSTSRTSTGSDAAILPTASPTRPALPATLEEINLKLEVTERTWLETTIDDEIVFSGIARAGDTYEWTAATEAKLLTGNAIGVFVTINDIPLGRLGDRGQNKEEIWRTTQ